MRGKKLLLVSVAAATGMLFAALGGGCNGKTGSSTTESDAGETDATATTASLTVGVGGGTVTSLDGLASIEIPVGALTRDVVVTVTRIAAPTIPTVKVVGGAYLFGPAGTQLQLPATIMVPFDGTELPAGAFESNVRIMTVEDGSAAYQAVPTAVADTVHVKTVGTRFGSYVAVAPVTPGGDAQTADNCVVACEGPDDIDGGIGCNCGVTCNGIVYQVQCVCGACTCYQDGVPGKTTTLAVSACSFGGDGLRATYFNVCGYPGSHNRLSSGGPTSMDGGGSCP